MMHRVFPAVLFAFVLLASQPSFPHESEHHSVTQEILEELQGLRDDFDSVFGDRIDANLNDVDQDDDSDSADNNTGQSAADCLETRWDGKSLYYRNTCAYTIAIAYCDAVKPKNGEICGQNSKAGQPYYTHITSLCANEEWYWYDPTAIRYAVCRGYMHSFLPNENFTSNSNGDYSCPDLSNSYDACD